jgi:hypothetical protein
MLKNEDPANIYGIFQPCKCAELNNTLLMWSVLTYGAGFINWWIYKNECGYCQSHANILPKNDDYQNHIVDIKTIEMLINSNPDLIHESNANGDTIFNIIADVIIFIQDTIKTYEEPNTTLCNEIMIGKNHIKELENLLAWINNVALPPASTDQDPHPHPPASVGGQGVSPYQDPHPPPPPSLAAIGSFDI